jgi:hypothetical protein
MFPAGAAGVALLLLRLSLVSMLILRISSDQDTAVPMWAVLVLSITALCLMAGLYTPATCAICLAVEVLALTRLHGGQAYQTAVFLPVPVGLAILGPGAFSLDAKLFGRRVVVTDTQIRADR